MKVCASVCPRVRESEPRAARMGGEKNPLCQDPAELWRRLQLQLLASSFAHQLWPRRRLTGPGEGVFADFGSASAGSWIGGDPAPFPARGSRLPNFRGTTGLQALRPRPGAGAAAAQRPRWWSLAARLSDPTEELGFNLGLPVPQPSPVSRSAPGPWAASLSQERAMLRGMDIRALYICLGWI